MTDIHAAYERLLDRFADWAGKREDIRAAFVIGSRARRDRPADEWADLDLIFITTRPETYLRDTEWLDAIGTPILTFLEPTADGRGHERRVLFEGWLDVDFVPLPPEVARAVTAPDLVSMLRRGFRVVLDKMGLETALNRVVQEAPPTDPTPPDESEYRRVVHDFWYHVVWCAKHLRRGELAWAKGGCDGHLKQCLLSMIEWHARAMVGSDHDTWFRGRFLEHWADPRVVEAMRDAYAHYDAADVKRALFATVDLFRWVARETADRLGYGYPNDVDRRISDWTQACLAKWPT